MNLTKSLSLAMGCASIFAFTVSAAHEIEETFYKPGVMSGDKPQLLNGNWSVINAGVNDDSMVFDATADDSRWAFRATSTPLEGSTDMMVLSLNTEGDTLQRTIGRPFENPNGDPLQIDMMVKFVLSEDTPDGFDALVKFAIWADADSNLVVWATDVGGGAVTAEPCVLNDAKVDPEQWHRLTIKCTSMWDNYSAAFQVQLNGGEYLTAPLGWWVTESDEGQGGSIFFTSSDQTDDFTLNALQFQGTGFIDELVVTYDELDFGEGSGGVPFAGSGELVDPLLLSKWIAKYEIPGTEVSGMWNAFVLNVHPGDGTIPAGLKILSIEPAGTDTVITIGAGLEGSPMSNYTQYADNTIPADVVYPNGTLTLQKAVSLNAWEPAVKVNLAAPTGGITVSEDGKVTVPMNGCNFLKASVEYSY